MRKKKKEKKMFDMIKPRKWQRFVLSKGADDYFA